jgi:hypothetical protein
MMAAQRTSGRLGDSATSSRRQAQAAGGKELMIAGAVLLILAVVAGILYVIRTGEGQRVKEEYKRQQDIQARNFDHARDAFEKADILGRLYVTKGDPLTQDKLASEFRGNDNVYNIICEHQYKEVRKGEKTDRVSLYPEREMGVYPISTQSNREERDITYQYGLAENRHTPVIIASKNYAPAPGDRVNVGGKIVAIVRAETDIVFQNAMNKPLQEKKK